MIDEYKSMLFRVANAFKRNDVYFDGLDIEQRTFLNDVGKILGFIWLELIFYEHASASDEKKREIRRRMNKIRHQIEKIILLGEED